ncbi:JmjC domain-containing protein 7 [Trachymyrmex septentrionalis]|uniref:Bifunctional peptidase and (3S)-lysyl hydroxylase JMJD7 n=1 Tax=Trachymyrmex septentrionalis TaxID=34720 RepID=A0A151JZ60_9HYME|nr:PREDICTED: jmjC domain-containing protein 7 [Trachymyrmex septentrionalis]KYN41660.1 JmjC domain-containing protein 7 [Trachymyrmex septentrionalis]
MSNPEVKIQEAFHILSQEAKELYLQSEVAEINHSITPLAFYREYVSKNVPLVIRGAIKHWPAIDKWSIPYFRKVLADEKISVAVTPNGYADAVIKGDDGTKEFFVMPEERLLTISAFLDTLENTIENSVFYIQKQNSNFIHSFCKLWPDAEIEILWASEAFGKHPDAVNFWMGDERAVTSMHKDPYENIHCVVSGKKNFILHPPTDLPWIPYQNYPSAVYKEHKPGKWIIESINETLDSGRITNLTSTPWICIDPLNPNYEKYPEYRNTHNLKVTLRAGDILYLPSLWFHHVTQSHACISINYWYDMEFDIKYAYFKALETLCK